MTANQLNSFHQLSPDEVLNTVEKVGIECDGRLLALNSYENRVYRIGVTNDSGNSNNLVAKFYRPKRWSDSTILEEHAFTQQLADLDIPVVSPLQINNETLFTQGDYRFSLFKNHGGRAPDLESHDQLEQMGRFIGRIHQAGKLTPFKHRPSLTVDTFGHEPSDRVLNSNVLPSELVNAYQSVTKQLLDEILLCYQRADNPTLIRTHCDSHPGNILVTDNGFHIVDFDDARMAPAVQDIWMFLSGDRADMTAGLDAFLSGYTEFCEFNAIELHLIEALRSLRLIHYYGWLTKRWSDPAFKRAFPWFNTQQCWEQHILDLREQTAALHEPPLVWMG